jgi:hypothetical protein
MNQDVLNQDQFVSFFQIKFQKFQINSLSSFLVYIKATAILCVITAVADAIATLLTGLGLKTIDPNLKYRVIIETFLSNLKRDNNKIHLIFSFIDSQF